MMAGDRCQALGGREDFCTQGPLPVQVRSPAFRRWGLPRPRADAMRQFVASAANRVGRKGSRFIVASPSTISSITSFPSSGACVTPLCVTQR